MDDFVLPAAYGRTRLTLLPVDPYRIHAYWEVTAADLEAALELAGNDAQAVLRFYTAGKTTVEDTANDFFDVVVRLEVRKWYVDLWSALDSCYAELALRKNDGTLIRLARSQVIQLPRAQPTMQVETRFLEVEATQNPSEKRAVIDRVHGVSPPALDRPHPTEAHPAAEKPRLLQPRELRPPPKKRIDAQEIVREILSRVYASILKDRPLSSGSQPGKATEDLTSIAERKLAAGVSSSDSGNRPGGGSENQK